MGDLRTYKIALATLPEGQSEFTYTLDTEFFQAMEQSDIVGADVNVCVQIDHKNDAYYFHISACGELSVPCDRCLEPMVLEVEEHDEFTVKYGMEYDDSTEGLLILSEQDTMLDMAPLLCDMLLLSIPMRHVHPEGDCDPAMHRILQEHATEELPAEDQMD